MCSLLAPPAPDSWTKHSADDHLLIVSTPVLTCWSLIILGIICWNKAFMCSPVGWNNDNLDLVDLLQHSGLSVICHLCQWCHHFVLIPLSSLPPFTAKPSYSFILIPVKPSNNNKKSVRQNRTEQSSDQSVAGLFFTLSLKTIHTLSL